MLNLLVYPTNKFSLKFLEYTDSYKDKNAIIKYINNNNNIK